MALFAPCASLTVNAVKQPWERKPHAHATADRVATAVALDMTAHWTPTVRSYLGRVTKADILAAVREAVSDAAAERIAEDLGVGLSTLRRWIDKRRDALMESPPPGRVEDMAMEMKRLRQEREILKKATAFFAREGSR